MDRRRVARDRPRPRVGLRASGPGGLFAQPVYATGLDWQSLSAWRFAIRGAAAPGCGCLGFGGATARRCGRLEPPAGRRRGRGSASVHRQRRARTTPGLETVPASLAGAHRLPLPGVVAVLSLRYATPARGPPRRGSRSGLALVGVVLALGGIDRRARRRRSAACCSILASPRDLRRLDRAVRAARGRADATTWSASRGRRRRRHGGRATTLMMTATAVVVRRLPRSCTGPPLAPASIPADAWPCLVAIGFVAHVRRDPDVLRRDAADRRRPGRARQHGRAVAHRHARRRCCSTRRSPDPAGRRGDPRRGRSSSSGVLIAQAPRSRRSARSGPGVRLADE